jgi:hypothetical protein
MCKMPFVDDHYMKNIYSHTKLFKGRKNIQVFL